MDLEIGLKKISIKLFLQMFFCKFTNRLLVFLYLFFSFLPLKGQDTFFGNFEIDDFLRRETLIAEKNDNLGLMLRSVSFSPEFFFFKKDSLNKGKDFFEYKILPFYLSSRLDVNRPYVGGEYGLVPARGVQSLFSTGIHARFFNLNIQIQPEFVFAQNHSFSGFPKTFSKEITETRFLYWNLGDSPERFGYSTYKKLFWGQSSISLRAGAFEIEAGTKNFWWGPGQWNSLIFSNNAPGFPNINLKTVKPAKTYIGSFEGQLLVGRLESSNQVPTQIDSLNSGYFTPLNPDWRYLNALILSFNPKWIPGLSFGYARTYQYYNSDRPNDLKGWLPVLEPMAKEKLFANGNSVVYDDRRQSQQISIFGRFKMTKARAELYFQFGRRDHALNWREFFLNPEHARAYQVGFLKLTNFLNSDKLLQIRGEITHQQESVNRYLRYGLAGATWHTHGQVRGFTNYGQPMGVSIGTGSNVQTFEVSLVDDWKKLGVLFERLENNQDFYYRALGQLGERKPWIDWSTAILWNASYMDLFISARLQGTYARNYQWVLSETSNSEFPVSQDLFSVHSQVNLIYFIRTQKTK
uniref:capsule assembly Wzi family protein n=1 Tax=Algoriphagus sp. TaxID=1872435 RepID=UPI004047181B